MQRTFTRTPQACETCRRRKTKCDGKRPRCSFCRTKRLQCTWLSPDSGSAERPVSRPSFSISSVSSSPPVASADVDATGLRLCLEVFFDRHFAIDFCSFDYRPEFERRCAQEPILSYCLLSLCGRYLDPVVAEDSFGMAPKQVSRTFMKKARSLAKEKSDEPSVTHIQAHLILALAELLSNSGSRHWLFAGTAIRMAEIMRLNKDFHQKHSLRDQEIRRRTFWACVLFDRTLAYLLGKHRTVDLENVSIPLPGTEMSLVYQEPSRGVLLGTLAAYRRPSDLGIGPYLVKTVCVWSDIADFAMHSRRQTDQYPPTDSRSIFFARSAELLAWGGSLPPSLVWTEQNFVDQAALGQAKTYISMQFLLHSAFCVAHQCYLPHMTLYTKLVNLVDGSGLPYLHRDPSIIETCVTHALKVGSMLEYLMNREQESVLQTVWVASSLLIVVNTFLWLQFAEDEICSELGRREQAVHYYDLIHQLITSWTPTLKAAQKWKSALDSMHRLYKAAYLGQVDEDILSRDGGPDPGDDPYSDTESANDFRPQPGDGYPTFISLPLLQSSLKFATSDTSAKSISLQSIWLQLSGGWLYGNLDFGMLAETDVANAANAFQPTVLDGPAESHIDL